MKCFTWIRMTQGIDRLKNHVLLCGYGRIGRVLAQQFKRQRQPFVVIENEQDVVMDEAETHYESALSEIDTMKEVFMATATEARMGRIISVLATFYVSSVKNDIIATITEVSTIGWVPASSSSAT